MPDRQLEYRVVDGILRMILIKTLPGRELEVGRFIEDKCRDKGLTGSDYKIFRILGDYDLAFLNDNASLRADMFVKLGTIPYITATSEYLCYKWGNDDYCSFDLGGLSDPLVSICFLKINPRITKKDGIRSEIEFVKYLSESKNKLQIVGTLGWFEIVIFASKGSMYSLLNDVHNELMPLVYHYGDAESEYYGFPEKTLSLIGHELDVSDREVNTKRSKVPMFHSLLRKEDVAVDVTLSCRPRAMTKLYKYASAHFGDGGEPTPENIRMLYGPRDIFVQVPLENHSEFNDIIYALDDFRKEARSILVKTHTHIQYRKGEFLGYVTDPDEVIEEVSPDIPLFKIDSDQAKVMVELSTETAEVVSAVYRYNNYIENALISDAFLDLLKFVWMTKGIAASADRSLSIETRQRIVDRLRILREGIEQRSQGVYVGVDESPFALNATGLGLGRALKGIEGYVHNLLTGLGIEWLGFILYGSHSKYEHLEEALIMPAHALLNPGNQWEITHEAMHILQHQERKRLSMKRLFSSETPLHRAFSAPSKLGNLMNEICADLFDFAFCCPLPIDEYIRVVWDYLCKTIFKEYNQKQIKDYMYRTLTVMSYDFCQASNADVGGRINREILREALLEQKGYFSDYYNVMSSDGENRNQYVRIVNEYIVDMYNVLPHLFESMTYVEKRKKPISREVATSIIDRLMKGEIISHHELTNPESIVWYMASLKTEILGSSASIAWILSLWNMYFMNKYEVDVFTDQ